MGMPTWSKLSTLKRHAHVRLRGRHSALVKIITALAISVGASQSFAANDTYYIRMLDSLGNAITSTINGLSRGLDVNCLNCSGGGGGVASTVAQGNAGPSPWPVYVFPNPSASPLPVSFTQPISVTGSFPTPPASQAVTGAFPTPPASQAVTGAFPTPPASQAVTGAFPTPPASQAVTGSFPTPIPFPTTQNVAIISSTPIAVTGSFPTPPPSQAITGTFPTPIPFPTTQNVAIISSTPIAVTGSFPTPPPSQAVTGAFPTPVNNITATQGTGTNLHVDVDTALPSGTNVIGHVINDAGSAVIGHVIVDTAPSTAVTGTFFQATQPVSLAAASISGSNPCANPTATLLAVNGATSGTSKVQLIALSGTTKIYICSINITGVSGTTPTFSLVYGTGTACATGTTTIIGAWTTTANTIYNFPGPEVAVTGAGTELCYLDGGTSPVQNYNITYVQQ